MIGLTPFTGLVLAAIIVIIMYFGLKLYVEKRKQSMESDVGDGLCMECGSAVIDKKCPKCDYPKE